MSRYILRITPLCCRILLLKIWNLYNRWKKFKIYSVWVVEFRRQRGFLNEYWKLYMLTHPDTYYFWCKILLSNKPWMQLRGACVCSSDLFVGKIWREVGLLNFQYINIRFWQVGHFTYNTCNVTKISFVINQISLVIF